MMPLDLERAFEDLRAHTRSVVLPTAADLRRRGDRRRRTRVATALVTAAAAVAVLTVSVGVPGLLGSGRSLSPAAPSTVPQTPPIAPSPSPAPGPSEQPSPSPVDPPEYYEESIDLPPGCEDGTVALVQVRKFAGDPLPASIMLRPADWGRCYEMYADHDGYEVYSPDYVRPAPALCEGYRTYPADEHRVAGRVQEFYGGPEISGSQRVTRYAAGQAAAFMDQVRQAVSDCPAFSLDGEPWHVRILDTGFAGDDSMIIFIGTQPETPDKSYPGVFQAVVRVGDLVVIVFPGFDLGGDRAYTIEMAQKAVARLR